MNISPISMVNHIPSFSAQKQIVHRNSDEDFWIETIEEPKDEIEIHRNSDEDWYPVKVDKKPVNKTTKSPSEPRSTVHYEKGPNEQLGVWTRNGGSYAFFTPAKDIAAKEAKKATAEVETAKKPSIDMQTYLRWGM